MSGGSAPTVLVLGYGNPGRCDDGLGPALAHEIAARGLAGVRTESAYQLALEDAALAAEHDVVVFADASRTGAGPFEFREAAPLVRHEFTTHALSPEAVLGVARDVLAARPRAWVLAIRGESFDAFGEGLSPAAAANLAAAVEFLDREIRSGLRRPRRSEG